MDIKKEEINEQDIRKIYDFLGHKNQAELRFIKPRWKEGNSKPIQEWANNFEQFLSLCKKYNGDFNLYVGLNERKSKGDKDEDVEFITNIGHDIDAHDGNPESYMKAQEAALKLKEDFIKKGYNEPLVLCSGRGFWVIHHIAPLKNNEGNKKRIKEFANVLKKKYEVEGIEFDSTVYNASRIARISGTLNISDKENQVKSFIINEPENFEDTKLKDMILNIKIEEKNYTINSIAENKESDCRFMDYCLTHEIPKGERHRVISRNMSIYVHKHPDKELLKEQYFKVQKGSENELDQWLKSIDNNPDTKYPFSCGELINFQKKYKIPNKCKGCPKFEIYKKEKKAEENLKKQIEIDKQAEVKGKEIKYFFTKKNLAEQFIELQPLFYDKSKSWWIWDFKEYRWIRVDEVDVMNLISDKSEANTTKANEKNEILEALRQVSRKKAPKDIKTNWVQFKNKIINIMTGEIFDATEEYFVTNPIPYELNKDNFDQTPIMDEIFEQWVGKEYVQTLYEIIAYCLILDYPINRIFCFIGGGMNGKSKYLELLRKFIGQDNVCSTELDTLLSSRFEVTRLHKKLVCQMGETNFNEMNKTSILKKLSGGDLIGFEYKKKDPFEEVNYAKILISTNNLPATTDKTIGFYRRWMIVDFPNQFSEKVDILKKIPEEEYNSLALKCTHILKDLLTKREFTNEGSIEERMKRYENKSNPIKNFLDEFCLTEDPDAQLTKSAFEKKLNDWLKDNKLRSMSDIAITKYMKSHGFEDGRGYIDWYENDKIIKKRARIWMGVTFK